ncbi:MAG: transketolase [Bacteroidales bacterium]
MKENLSKKSADNIRILSASMVEKAKSGHPGGSMGGADFIQILYSEFLNYNPDQGEWMLRDRFFLDPGHMSPMLYSVLTLNGFFTLDEIKQFRQWGSPTAGHPELEVTRGIENTSGPLGQGHAMGIGAAIAERFLCQRFGETISHKTYVYISDGGIQEEISQGAGRIAGFLGLSNLIMFYDANDIQLSTKVNEVTSENTAQKYEAWGWKVVTINGNDENEIRAALSGAQNEKEKPTLIIGKTIMGKGAVDANGNSFENKVSTHGQPLSAAGASFEKTIENLGGNAGDPFVIFPEVAEYYKLVNENKRVQASLKNEQFSRWKDENPELARKYQDFILRKLPPLDFGSIKQDENTATRSASGNVLAYLAQNVENMIVASADLSESDKTISFLKKSKAFVKGDFSGAFLQAGVSELSMAAICNGMALHGGVIPVCATFFVFSDYMKPALRLSALMELPVIYLWTHDSFRVGEDGPTHQPVEHEAQLRLMEQLKNHKGNQSVLVLRPAGAAETTVAWEMALENSHSPSALILSRQNMKEVELWDHLFYYDRAKKARKGAYIMWESNRGENPDLILIANGSEVSTLFEAAKLVLEKKSIKIRIVSIISTGLFKSQAEEYRKSIIPSGIQIIGLTAGLPAALAPVVGDKGKVFGLDHFGYSAPAGVLDDKLGFTPAKAAQFIMNNM